MNRKQRAFVEEYLSIWNATEAARRAGYKHAHVQGPRLLANVSIKAAVQTRLEEKAMGADEVLTRLAEQARADFKNYAKVVERWTRWPLPSEEIIQDEERIEEVDGKQVRRIYYLVRKTVLDLDALTDDRARLIKEFTDSPKHGIQVKLLDSQAALFKIGQKHGLFTDRSELNVNLRVEGLTELLDRLYGNAAGGSQD
jgi:phage terminase small subunit